MDKPELYLTSTLQTVRDGREYLDEITKTIIWSKCEKILDVGCGPGGFTRDVLSPFVPDDVTIEACDLSEKMINFANNNFKHPRIIYKVMDIENTKILESSSRESYAKIFSFYLFHWIVKYREAFRNMYSLLKRGGEVYNLFFAENKVLLIVAEMRNSEPWKNFIKGPEYLKWYVNKTIEERKVMFLEEMTEAGFKNIQIDVKRSVFAYPSLEHFLKLVASIDLYRKYIPEHLIEEYNRHIEEKVRKIITIQPESGQVIRSCFLFAIRAKKL